MFRGGKGQSAASRLTALPAGSHVRLEYGAVYVKAETRWNVAGSNGCPLSTKALLRLNGGRMPTVMVPAANTPYRDSW